MQKKDGSPLLSRLSDPEGWERFYEYKTSLACPKDMAKGLRRFIDEKGYLPVCAGISEGRRFPLPKRSVISKIYTEKKRVVYTYPYAENTVLKYLTWLLLRKYDGLFSEGLYSFRPRRTAKDAVRRLQKTPGIRGLYSYKADISNYFNSIPINRLLPLLEEAVSDDPGLFAFLKELLSEPYVLKNGQPVTEEKGIMAGTPLSAFFANLYLRDLDRHFAETGIPYARYSDDIILFAASREKTEEYAACIRSFLASCGLAVNPSKECFRSPEEGWIFLGFIYKDGVIDIAPASVDKLKHKMRRKTRALMRWRKRNGLPGERAAAAFIRIFNRKLLESAGDNELTWCHWYFSVINTTESLHTIDLYAQECIRYLLTGTRTKSRFNARYDDLKKLGYRNLVHEYYGSGRV